MHKVERAVILAAGKGERLRPVTLDTPKPLVRVNGVRMIDTILNALLHHGITEIYVVTGYCKEQFCELANDFPQIVLLDNPWYESCNNISSLYAAREHLENAFIIDGDQMIHSEAVLSPYFERSGYNAVWMERSENEWMMTVQDGIVTGCKKNGGTDAWQLYSISRWSAEDARKLRRHLELEFVQNNNRQIYWDDIPMFCHADAYTLGITQMNAQDVLEIDTLAELIHADSSYRHYHEG